MGKKAAIIETSVGIFMLFAFTGLIFLALRVSGLTSLAASDSYEVNARFTNVAGLKVRAPVSMAGVQIGRVKDINFDKKTFDAIVTLSIHNRYDELPADTSATIYTSGLLGEKYIGLEAGGDSELLKEGSEITLDLTQSSLILEQLIGQFLTNMSQK